MASDGEVPFGMEEATDNKTEESTLPKKNIECRIYVLL